MATQQEPEIQPGSFHPQCRNYGAAFLIMSMLIAVLFVADLYTLRRLNSTEREERGLRASLGKGILDVQNQNQELLRKYVLLRDSHRHEVADLRTELDRAALQLGSSSSRVLDRARSMVGVLQKEQARQVDNLEDQIAQKADAQDLDSLREGVSTTGLVLGTTEKTLGTLATDLGTTRSQLGELASSTAQQIRALHDKTDGDYREFTLSKDRPLHLGRVGLRLRKTSPRKQVFSLDVAANDQEIRHSGHNVNEPIYFYVGRSAVPYELVVTSVGSDDVAGYLRVPKVEQLAERSVPQT